MNDHKKQMLKQAESFFILNLHEFAWLRYEDKTITIGLKSGTTMELGTCSADVAAEFADDLDTSLENLGCFV